jgi:hypothetical protein
MEQRSTARANIPPHRTAVGNFRQAADWSVFRICYSSILALLSPNAPAGCSFFGHSAAAERGQRGSNSRAYRNARSLHETTELRHRGHTAAIKKTQSDERAFVSPFIGGRQ